MYSKTIAVGRLTRDPELKTFGENTVCRFTIAVDDGFGDKKTTDFVNCSAWGKTGESIQKFNKKGSILMVEGKFKSSKKDDKTYWELRADQVKFLSSNNENQQSNAQTNGQQQPQYQQPQTQQYQQPQYQQQQQYQQPTYQQQPQYQQQYQQPQFQQQANSFPMDISDDQLPF